MIQVRLPPARRAPAATRPAPRPRRLQPAGSSNGSASSYDNLDEPSAARHQPWLPRSSRPGRPAGGSGTDEALDDGGQRSTPGEPATVDVGTGPAGVWRRPTLDGHFQVVPPTMIGVFDPTSQLSKFATQRTSPVVNYQRRRANATRVPETVPKEATSRTEDVSFKQIGFNRVRDERTFNAAAVQKSPAPIFAQNSQPLESVEATESKRNSPGDEPPKVAASRSPATCETAGDEAQRPAEDAEGSSTSSSSSSSSDDGDVEAQCAEIDNEGAALCADAGSPAVDSERLPAEEVECDTRRAALSEDVPCSRFAADASAECAGDISHGISGVESERRLPTETTPTSGTRSSSDASPDAVDDVSVEQYSEQAATSHQQQLSTTPSQDDRVSGGHVADSPLPLPVPATSPSVVDVDVERPQDVENEASSSSTSSSQSNSTCCGNIEQDKNFEEQPELRISTSDHGMSDLYQCT